MRDAANTAPDLALILHPEDEARFIAMCHAPCGRGPAQPGFLYAVLHRRHGIWTHLYRVVPDPRPGRQLVFLEKAWPGDRLAEAEAWARQRFAGETARISGKDAADSPLRPAGAEREVASGSVNSR